VFLVVILGALLLQRGRLSRAMEGAMSSWSSTGVLKPVPEELRRVPEVLWSKRLLGLILAAAFIFIPATWSGTNQMLASLAVIWGMAAVSLVILTGWGGHISLGQFAIVGVGALATANLVDRWNADFFLALIAAGAVGALLALLVGLPALRIKGLFLAVTTLAFAVALDSYIINEQNFGWMMPGRIERPLLLERFDMTQNYTMYLVCLVFLGLSILVAQGLRKARAGRVILATRDNQRAADAASVPTTSVKLAAFVVSGAIAGVAGGLHVLLIRSVETGSYPPYFSIDLFATAVIGGLGSIAGALTGVLVFQWIASITQLGDIRPFITGGVLLIVLLAVPGGLGQLLYNVRDRFLRRVADRRGILVPSLVADKREGEDQPTDETGLLSNALSDPTAATTR
jgi:branched-chain amino acid transport system permease protein